MIPGTIFMSLLAGALFGVVRGLFLVVFNATAGASSCYFLSKLIGRPLVSWLWPEKLRLFQAEVCVGVYVNSNEFIYVCMYMHTYICMYICILLSQFNNIVILKLFVYLTFS